jgi:hypothetical protein
MHPFLGKPLGIYMRQRLKGLQGYKKEIEQGDGGKEGRGEGGCGGKEI